MFEDFRLVMDFIPPIPQGLDEKGLQEPVPAYHHHRMLTARVRQLNAAVSRMRNEPPVGQFPHALGSRRCADPQTVRQSADCDRRRGPLRG